MVVLTKFANVVWRYYCVFFYAQNIAHHVWA